MDDLSMMISLDRFSAQYLQARMFPARQTFTELIIPLKKNFRRISHTKTQRHKGQEAYKEINPINSCVSKKKSQFNKANANFPPYIECSFLIEVAYSCVLEAKP